MHDMHDRCPRRTRGMGGCVRGLFHALAGFHCGVDRDGLRSWEYTGKLRAHRVEPSPGRSARDLPGRRPTDAHNIPSVARSCNALCQSICLALTEYGSIARMRIR